MSSCLRMLLLVVCGCCCVPLSVLADNHTSSLAPKPRSPVSVDIQYTAPAVAGQTFEFTVLVSTAVDADLVNVQIELPAGSVVQTGNLTWSGALYRDEVKQLNLQVKLPERIAQPVIASAVIGEFDAAQFGGRAIYEISSGTVFHAAAATTAKPRTVMREGKRVQEYALQ